MTKIKKGKLNATVDIQLLNRLEKVRTQGNYKIPRSQIVEKALEEYLKKEAKK